MNSCSIYNKETKYLRRKQTTRGAAMAPVVIGGTNFYTGLEFLIHHASILPQGSKKINIKNVVVNVMDCRDFGEGTEPFPGPMPGGSFFLLGRDLSAGRVLLSFQRKRIAQTFIKEVVITMITFDDNEFHRGVGERFKNFREILGLSPQQLAAELDATVAEIERIEEGAITNQRPLLFISVLGQDYGLSINWFFTGLGRAFARRGPKTPREIYENYNKGFHTVDDDQLLTDLFYLLQIPDARQVINGQVAILKLALKKQLEALRSSQMPGKTKETKKAVEVE
jgi:transcriptional regulator with XRE-family HTH domain